MAFDNFLNSRRGACRALVNELQKRYRYVSVLGANVRSTALRVNKLTSAIGDGSDNDCGFVVKMWDGREFFECSLDDVEGDASKLAAEIYEAVRTSNSVSKRIAGALADEEPLKKDFCADCDFDDFDDAYLLDFACGVRDELLKKCDKLVNATVVLRTMQVNKLFVSQKRELSQSYGFANGIMLASYRDGDKLVNARAGENRPLLKDVLDDLPKGIDALIEKAAHLAKATPIKPGLYDVITDPSITGLLAHEAFGHGVEMDMFVKDRALAKHCIGTQVASPICNMRDGAAAATNVASFFFDDDGVTAGDTQIIKNGILVKGISDLASASQLGTAPTGNGRRESHLRKAYTRMTNTFFERGSDKLEDMIASVKHGYMIFETNNGMEDPKSWQVQCVAEYGREIVDGKLTDNYVSPVVMSGYVPDVLKSITMISDDFELEGAGMCGKGHKEWVRVSDGGPALKLKVRLG